MCIVLDASRFGKFQQRDDENMKPVRDWVYRGNGKIAYATTEDLKREWDKEAPKLRTQLQRRAKLKLVPRNSVQRKQIELEGKNTVERRAHHRISHCSRSAIVGFRGQEIMQRFYESRFGRW